MGRSSSTTTTPTLPQHSPHQQHYQNSSSNRRRSGHSFPIGTLVEVQTDEEDFKAVYFLATIIFPPPISGRRRNAANKHKLYVEYHNLLAREGGSERLTEYVPVSFVRPAPPPQEHLKGFEPHDYVDAFYKDGWWRGIVKRAVERGERFVVTFDHPPDELEFGLAELRVHWDWVDGTWIRPGNKVVNAVEMFDVGRKVEVSLDEEDCRDAWFPALIHDNLGDGAYVAEYSKMDAADSKGHTLKVTVDTHHVRPSPPHLKEKNFVLLEKVDAYFNFGWWGGVITKELEGSRYEVFFKQMKKNKEFHQSELRPCMEWKEGKWFISSQLSQDPLILPSEDVMHEQHTPENSSGDIVAVPFSNVDDNKETADGNTASLLNLAKNLSEKSTPETQEVSQAGRPLRKRAQRSYRSQEAIFHPHKKQKERTIHSASQQNTHDISTKKVFTGSLSPVPMIDQSDNPNWGKRIQRKQRKVGTARYSKKKNSASSPVKRSKQIPQVQSPEADDGGKEPNAVGNISEDVDGVQNKLMKTDSELSVVIGLPCTEMGSPESGRFSRGKKGHRFNGKETTKSSTDQKQQQDDSSVRELKESKLSETGEINAKKKRGRPRKSLQTPIIGTAQNGVLALDDSSRIYSDPQGTAEVVTGSEASLLSKEMEVDELQDKQANSRSGRKNLKGSMSKRSLSNLRDGEVVKESNKLQQIHSTGRGKKQNTDSPDASVEKTGEANCSGKVMEVDSEAHFSECENEPLSKWIGGMHAVSIVASSIPSPMNNVEECTEKNQRLEEGLHVLENGNEKLLETRDQSFCSGSVDPLSVDQSDQQNLPFVKNNILWKTIESMEVFRRIPQRPHFQPLYQCTESLREGLAIGYMVSFSGVVETISKFNDAESITDDVLETLADLDKHGFDVTVLQERVTRLTSFKDRKGKLMDDLTEINKQIIEQNHEKSSVELEIDDINQQMQKLQEKLLLAEYKKEKKNEEVATLQAKLLETKENIKSIEHEIQGIAATGF